MSRRPVSKDERQLWRRVTKDVRPLTGHTAQENMDDMLHHSAPVFDKKPSVSKAKVASSSIARVAPQAFRQSVLQAGDPRATRAVRRGKREIDATLDLHGMTQDEAYTTLHLFLAKARARDLKTLLIITGKGARETMHAPIHTVSRGVLRHRFMEWMDGPFRDQVSRIDQAHQRHGGSGAFYVILKKPDTERK